MSHWPLPAGKHPAIGGAAVTVPAVIRSAWTLSGISFVLLLLVLVAAYWSTVVSIVAIWWRSETFAHGFFMLPISLYMMWIRRDTLARLTPEPNLWGLPLLALLGLAWALGYAANVVLVQQLSFATMIPLLVLTLLGTRITAAIAFPLGYLYFAIPFGEFLIPPLMDWTAWFSVKALQATGIPVYAEGRFITVPTATWEVAEVCAGLRYLIASLAVGCLYAYLSYRSAWRRLAFIAVAAIVPIIANGIRAYGIIMIGHLSGMRLAAGVDHIIYGWLFFGVVIGALFWIGSLWREPDASPQDALPAAAGGEENTTAGMRGSEWRKYLAAIGALVFLLIGPAAAALLDGSAGDAPLSELRLPAGTNGWVGPMAADAAWEPKFPQVGQRVHRMYRRENRRIYVYVIHYPSQRQGQELISQRNHVYGNTYWRRIAEARHSVALADGGLFAVAETAMRSARTNRLVWWWYEIAGQSTLSTLVGKALESWARISNDSRGSSLVMVAADYEQNPEDARESLQRFLVDMPAFRKPGALLANTP